MQKKKIKSAKKYRKKAIKHKQKCEKEKNTKKCKNI